MKPLQLSVDAEADFLAIVDFLSDSSVPGALRTIDAIEAGLEHLHRFPGAGHPHHDLPPRYRVVNVGVWAIIHREEDDRVVVARIVHGGRDLRELHPE